MFTQEEYRKYLPRLLQLPLMPCEYWNLESFGAEECVSIARGGPEFESGLHFFVNALRFYGRGATDPDERLFADFAQAKISPMDQNEFRQFASENVPPTWALRDWPFHSAAHFRSAQLMVADWNDIAAIARFGDWFAVVFWNTGA